MKKLQFTVIALFLSLMAVSGQEQSDVFSGSFSSKARYAAGKNIYLMDECRVNYTYKVVLGSPVYQADMVWTRRNDFTVNNVKISHADLNAHPDLQKRFELITPVSVRFKFTMLFYSNQIKAYIASAKSEITVSTPQRAGSTAVLSIPTTGTWAEMFSDVVIGRQEQRSPGVVKPDPALENHFQLERINYGKQDRNNTRSFGRAMRHIFSVSDRIEILNVEMEVEWDETDYAYIIEEYARRQNTSRQSNKQRAESAYFDNRTFKPSMSEEDRDFWYTTTTPYEIWMRALEEADNMFDRRRFAEAKALYKRVAEAAPNLSYPVRKMDQIQRFIDHRASRNVGDLELVYVEGNGVIRSFYMGRTEVTQGQWRRVMGSNPSGFRGCSNCPVENVSWEEVQEFLKRLNHQTGMRYRLPRLDEWEYAASGGRRSLRTRFSGSDNIGEVAWCVYNAEESTHSVAQKAPNELGIYDMTGNVSEWVANMFDRNTRFVKGGSWSDDARNSTIESNEKYDVKHKNNRIGFRVCQDE